MEINEFIKYINEKNRIIESVIAKKFENSIYSSDEFKSEPFENVKDTNKKSNKAKTYSNSDYKEEPWQAFGYENSIYKRDYKESQKYKNSDDTNKNSSSAFPFENAVYKRDYYQSDIFDDVDDTNRPSDIANNFGNSKDTNKDSKKSEPFENAKYNKKAKLSTFGFVNAKSTNGAINDKIAELLKEKLKFDTNQFTKDYTDNKTTEKLAKSSEFPKLKPEKSYHVKWYSVGKILDKNLIQRESDYKKKYTVNDKEHILYHISNLDPERGKVKANSDEKSGIFANTKLNPRDKTGKVDADLKRKQYKVHLRNYWKYASSNGVSTTPELFGSVNLPSSFDSGYKKRLNDRLVGAASIQDPLVTPKNFLAGVGLGTDEFNKLMNVTDLLTLNKASAAISSATSGWQGTGIANRSLLTEEDLLRYGTLEKKDTIIDTGRFTKYHTKKVEAGGSFNSAYTYKPVKIMKSFFLTDPIRTPYFRRQLALGTEVSMLSTVVDTKLLSRINYDIKYVNLDIRDDAPVSGESRHFSYKLNGRKFDNHEDTPLGIIKYRMPDFMSNMYNVYITVGVDEKSLVETTGNIKYKGHSVPIEGLISKYFNKNYFSKEVIATRCTGVQVKMPELKSNSIGFLGRKVAYIQSDINFNREASLTLRLDETLDIYKGILSASGVDYVSELDLDINELKRHINKFAPAFNYRRNGIEIRKELPDTINVHVRYGFTSGMLLSDKPDRNSTPYGISAGPLVYTPNGKEAYFREFIFTNVRFLGTSELELGKDNSIVEQTFPFIYEDICEVTSGHKLES